MIEPGWTGYAALLVAFIASIAAASLWKPEARPSTQRYNSIDGLRGYLALAVVAHHFLLNWKLAVVGRWAPGENVLFDNLGPCAVAVFFMITAVLFYGKVVRSQGSLDWLGLYWGRVVRLTPLYAIVVAVMASIAMWHEGFSLIVPPLTLVSSIANWLAFAVVKAPLINGYEQTSLITAGIVWTLRYEWAFYFSLPILAYGVRAVGKTRPDIRITALSIAAISLAAVSSMGVAKDATTSVLAFALGALVFEIVQFPEIAKRLRSTWAAVFFVAVLVASLTIPGDGIHWARFTLLALAFLPVAAGNTVFGVLAWRSSVIIGDATYSIYLLHGIVLHLLFQALSPSALSSNALWALLPLIFVGVSTLAVAVYRGFERPLIDQGKASYAAWAHKRVRPLTVTDKASV